MFINMTFHRAGVTWLCLPRRSVCFIFFQWDKLSSFSHLFSEVSKNWALPAITAPRVLKNFKNSACLMSHSSPPHSFSYTSFVLVKIVVQYETLAQQHPEDEKKIYLISTRAITFNFLDPVRNDEKAKDTMKEPEREREVESYIPGQASLFNYEDLWRNAYNILLLLLSLSPFLGLSVLCVRFFFYYWKTLCYVYTKRGYGRSAHNT